MVTAEFVSTVVLAVIARDMTIAAGTVIATSLAVVTTLLPLIFEEVKPARGQDGAVRRIIGSGVRGSLGTNFAGAIASTNLFRFQRR